MIQVENDCGTLGKHMQVNDLWLAGVGIAKAFNKQTNTSKNAPHLYLTLSTVFPQLHHVRGVVTIHNFKKSNLKI